MDRSEAENGVWSQIAKNEGAAALIGTVLELDPDETHTRSELAAAAGVPLKELYLTDTLAMLVDIGLLDRVDEADEATFEIADEATAYRRAADFKTAIANQPHEDD